MGGPFSTTLKLLYVIICREASIYIRQGLQSKSTGSGLLTADCWQLSAVGYFNLQPTGRVAGNHITSAKNLFYQILAAGLLRLIVCQRGRLHCE